LIYLYVGLGMAMLLPIMVGLQTAVSVSELEQGEVSFQALGGKTLRDWEDEHVLNSPEALSAKAEGVGYEVRIYGGSKRCLVPKDNTFNEKCPEEYPSWLTR
jgi:hypothetical protein